MKKLYCLLTALILTLTLSTSVSALYETSDDVYSENVYMENLETGRVVVDIDSEERVYPASLTKILTCLIAIERFPDLSQTYEIPSGIFDDIYAQGGANIALKAGEVVTISDLIHATLIRSACDSATALAYCVSGGVDEFAKEMNKRAAELGAVNTHFVNAHGLHDDNHYSTARDLAIIAKFALQNQTFYDIISKWNYTIPATNKSDERYFETTMEIENPNSEHYYANVVGVKSGFTDEAGRCLITLAKKEGESYLLVTLGANKDKYYLYNMAYTDAVNLHEYCFARFSINTLISPNVPLTTVKIDGGTVESVQLYSASDATYLCAIDEQVKITYDLPDSIAAPVTVNTEVGTISVSVGEKVFTQSLFTATEAAKAKNSVIVSDNAFLSFLNVTTIAIYILTAIVLVLFCIVFFKKKKTSKK